MARLGKQIPSSVHGPIARRLHTKSSRSGLSDTHDKQEKTDRRRENKIPTSFRGPIARRLHTKPSRSGLSDTHDKQKKTVRRSVAKMNHGIVEKILLVLFVALVLLCTILMTRGY